MSFVYSKVFCRNILGRLDLFCDRVLYILGQPRNYSVVKDLELVLLLPILSADCRCVLPCPAYVIRGLNSELHACLASTLLT